jgi:D-methionine transport system substrate-binding protein
MKKLRLLLSSFVLSIFVAENVLAQQPSKTELKVGSVPGLYVDEFKVGVEPGLKNKSYSVRA